MNRERRGSSADKPCWTEPPGWRSYEDCKEAEGEVNPLAWGLRECVEGGRRFSTDAEAEFGGGEGETTKVLLAMLSAGRSVPRPVA